MKWVLTMIKIWCKLKAIMSKHCHAHCAAILRHENLRLPGKNIAINTQMNVVVIEGVDVLAVADLRGAQGTRASSWGPNFL